jgi:hypothetical protein
MLFVRAPDPRPQAEPAARLRARPRQARAGCARTRARPASRDPPAVPRAQAATERADNDTRAFDIPTVLRHTVCSKHSNKRTIDHRATRKVTMNESPAPADTMGWYRRSGVSQIHARRAKYCAARPRACKQSTILQLSLLHIQPELKEDDVGGSRHLVRRRRARRILLLQVRQLRQSYGETR